MDTSATQWTPGPWRATPILPHTIKDGVLEIHGGEPPKTYLLKHTWKDEADNLHTIFLGEVFRLPDTVTDRGNYRSNALLMSAAPALADVVEAAIATIERDRPLWESFPHLKRMDWGRLLSEMKLALATARGAQP